MKSNQKLAVAANIAAMGGKILYDKFMRNLNKRKRDGNDRDRKRRRIKSPKVSTGRKTKTSSRGSRGVVDIGSRSVAMFKKGKQVTKRIGKVRVSSNFRKKVTQVLDGKSPDGKYLEVHFGNVQANVNARFFGYGIDHGIPLPIPGGLWLDKQFTYNRTSATEWDFDCFHFHEMLVSLMRTWTDYPKNEAWDSDNVMANDVETNTLPAFTLSANGNPNFEYLNNQILEGDFKLKSCSAKYVLKNNTNRSYTLEWYTCSPKKQLNSQQQALKVWKDGLLQDEQNWDGVTGALSGTNPYGGAINMNGVTINTLKVNPGHTFSFNNLYSYEVKYIKIEPGQEFSFTIPGPKNVPFIPRKWAMLEKQQATGETNPGGSQHFTYKPGFSKSCFMILTPELLPTGDNNAGRLFDFTTETKLGIAVEKTVRYEWEMPDMTSFRRKIKTLAVGADNILNPLLNNRRRRYWHKIWTRGELNVTNVQRVDELVPGILQDLD